MKAPNPDNPRHIVDSFARRGITLTVSGDGQHLEAKPAGMLSVSDIVRLTEMKANVLQYLRANVRRF